MTPRWVQRFLCSILDEYTRTCDKENKNLDISFSTLKVLKSLWIWKSKYKTFEVHGIVCLLVQWSQMIIKVHEKYIFLEKCWNFSTKGQSATLMKKLASWMKREQWLYLTSSVTFQWCFWNSLESPSTFSSKKYEPCVLQQSLVSIMRLCLGGESSWQSSTGLYFLYTCQIKKDQYI